ncbi:MAG: Gfo/Idh/MocA family oxidoreductase, partial [Candidatus Hydrogenedentota bacterium]
MPSKPKYTITRRSFLKKASVATAAIAPTIIPGSALGLDGTVAPSDRIVIGAIATGGQAQSLIRNAVQQPDTQIVALCDINRPKVEGVKKTIDSYYENNDCSIHSDFREVIARDDIDALLIAPPDHWHAIPCIQAAQAGKDIYCEKPLTHTLDEGRAVVNAVKRHGIVFQVGSMQRSDRRMKIACELVQNGYLGKIKHINVGLPDGGHSENATDYPEVPDGIDYDFWVGAAKWTPYHPKRMDWNWRWWMDFGGGQLMDWVGHHGDIAHMGMDWNTRGPKTIESHTWVLPQNSNLYNGPVSYRAELTYKEGTTMTVGSMSVMPKVFTDHNDTGTQFFGENGDWIYVSRGRINSNNKELLDLEFGANDLRFRKRHKTHHDHQTRQTRQRTIHYRRPDRLKRPVLV